MAGLPPFISRFLMAAATGRRRRLSILIYHRVLAKRDSMLPELPTASEFRWQMELMRRHFNMLPLLEAQRLLRQGRLPPRAACVTFDDGYADNAMIAHPILAELGIPMTIFVATGSLDGGRMWNDTLLEAIRNSPYGELALREIGLPRYLITDEPSRKHVLQDIVRQCKQFDMTHRQDIVDYFSMHAPVSPGNLMMTSAQLKVLAEQGVEMGGHTVTHPILTRLSEEEARAEIVGCRHQLEAITGRPVRLFAYPNGQPKLDYDQSHTKMVQDAGFEAAVTTEWGVSDTRTDPFQLPRFTPWDKSEGRFLMRMALNHRFVPKQSR